MTITYCDITKKQVPAATTNYTWETKERRYDTLLDKDLSPAGKQKLEEDVYREMEQRKTFNFMEHKRILEERLRKNTK
jgi:hypothetical protein